VVVTVPEAYQTLSDVREVRFEFDERISERVTGGTIDGAVTVSPRAGDVRVTHGRRSLTIRVEGGFREGLVYRVTLQPVVSDMFGNRLADPFELIFSTGGEPVPTTVAGEVWDRISGSSVTDALVFATGADGLVYQAVSDRDGIFALRYLPGGTFSVTAFEDVNRNGEVDSTEVQGATTTQLAPGDTTLIDLAMLAPDSTAALAVGAEAIDSVTVVVEFDDYLEPTAPIEDLSVTLRRESGPAPSVVRSFHEADYAAFVTAVTDSFARLDSIDQAEAIERAQAEVAAGDTVDAAADTVAPGDSAAAADTVGDAVAAPVDPAAVAVDSTQTLPGSIVPGRIPPTTLDPLQGAAPGPTEDGRRLLPGRRIVLQLDALLPFDELFEVEVSGAVNINGLPGGGGTIELVRVTPPPDSASVGDSLAVPDSGLVPDTGVVSDTRVVADTGFVAVTGAAPVTGVPIRTSGTRSVFSPPHVARRRRRSRG
jgi:hypothetical protein